MLRKKSKEMQERFKGQLMASLASDSFFSSNAMASEASKKIRNSTLFSVPGFFSIFAGKGSPDCDSVRSPTSPLDHWFFSGVGTCSVQSPRSPGRCWDCSRVGLGLLDTLRDDPERKNLLLGPRMRAKQPKSSLLSVVGDGISLTRSLFSFSQLASHEKIESCCPTDKPPEIHYNSKPKSDASTGSMNGFMGSLSASEIELSEDYTCIISHGPNPKTTHIFGDCILENHMMESPDSSKNHQGGEGGDSLWIVKSSENSPPLPSNDFLSFCFSCKKKLEEGKDIYMYRGEKAFCSWSCRDLVMLLEEEVEMGKKSPTASSYQGLVLSS